MIFRAARADDLPALVAMLRDDPLGAARESEDLAPYQAAFARMVQEGANVIYVGEQGGEVIATYQLTFLSGLSRQGARRALVEAVRTRTDHRARGIGAQMMADAEARARAAGCSMIQLTTDKTRHDAHRFYERLGYQPSHIGMKKPL